MKTELLFSFYLLSTLFLVLSFVFLAKYKKFQAEQINNSADIYLFGVVFLGLYSFVMFLDSARFIVNKFLPSFSDNFGVYVNYLMIISSLLFVLLMSLCYLISVLLMKETTN